MRGSVNKAFLNNGGNMPFKTDNVCKEVKTFKKANEHQV